MFRISPTLEGFRAVFRRPSLTFAEISWRWTVGGAAAALFSFLFLEYLDTLPVTNADLLLLRTRQPVLIGQAFGHIFHGSLSRVVMAGLVATVALSLLWIFAGSLGRATTVRSLMDYFAVRTEEAANGQTPDPLASPVATAERSRPLGSLLRLNFLRAAVALAAILGFIGAAIVVNLISVSFSSSATSARVTSAGAPPSDPGAGLAFLLLFPLAGLILLAWSGLNWVLSLAGVFAVRDAGDAPEDALGALSAAVAFCRERGGAVFAVSSWTGLAHMTAFVVATTVVSMPLSLARIAPGWVVLAGVILVTLAYFAVADWLYMARLAGYVCIAEMPEALLAPALLPAAPPSAPPRMPGSGGELAPGAAPGVQTTVDRDEPILSDVPNLAVET
jgi:hypothetical protein